MKTGRLWINKKINAGDHVTLSISQVLPYNATFQQWLINFQSLPTSNDSLIIRKLSVSGPEYHIDLVNRVASTFNGQNVICNEKWEFKKGDQLSVFFANTQDMGMGFEAVFSEN